MRNTRGIALYGFHESSVSKDRSIHSPDFLRMASHLNSNLFIRSVEN